MFSNVDLVFAFIVLDQHRMFPSVLLIELVNVLMFSSLFEMLDSADYKLDFSSSSAYDIIFSFFC